MFYKKYLYYLTIKLIVPALLLKSATIDDNSLWKAAAAKGTQKIKQVLTILKKQGRSIDYKDIRGNPLLIYTTYFHNFPGTQLLIKSGARVNESNNDLDTPLTIAFNQNKKVKKLNIQLIKLLLQEGNANPNIKNKKGESPLLLAINRIDNEDEVLETIKLLVEKGKGANNVINQPDNLGFVPLLAATKRNFYKVAKYLIEEGAEINYHDGKGRTPVRVATWLHHTNILNLLIKNHANIKLGEDKGMHLLMVALSKSNLIKVETIRILIKDCNLKANIPNLLLVALRNVKNQKDLLEIAKLLIEGEANINQSDSHKVTPLMSAISRDYTTLVEYFIKIGAKVSSIAENGENAIAIASRQHNTKILTLIFSKFKPFLNKNKGKGLTISPKVQHPLMLALTKQKGRKIKVETIRTLIEDYKINPNTFRQGETPLLRAIANINDENELLQVTKLLVEKGHANINTPNQNGFTPLMSTTSRDYKTLVEYFIKIGAKISSIAENGENAIAIASRQHNIKILNLLLAKFKPFLSKNKGKGLTISPKAQHPLMLALTKQKGRKIKVETIRILIEEYKINANTFRQGETPLLRALRNIKHEKELLQITKLLVEKGHANINASNQNGFTPLMSASRRGLLNIIKYLVEDRKIIPDQASNELEKSIKAALNQKHTQVVSYLQKKFKKQLAQKKINKITKKHTQLSKKPTSSEKQLAQSPDTTQKEQDEFKAKFKKQPTPPDTVRNGYSLTHFQKKIILIALAMIIISIPTTLIYWYKQRKTVTKKEPKPKKTNTYTTTDQKHTPFD